MRHGIGRGVGLAFGAVLVAALAPSAAKLLAAGET